MTTEKRVRTTATQNHLCEDRGYDDCDGIQRWVPDPFIVEIEGRVEYGWYCKGVLELLEEEI